MGQNEWAIFLALLRTGNRFDPQVSLTNRQEALKTYRNSHKWELAQRDKARYLEKREEILARSNARYREKKR